ncbi:hypothetical protein EDB19DRAFT_1901407 [Suillus lakei]|nr:hypothetical protein EDB19DRAFT_1901407 [Suillus lakei]
MLDPQNTNHLWLLHALFLDDINQNCSDFQAEWNCHPIWGPDTNDKSPKDLQFLGQTLFSMYRDDCEGVHPDVIVIVEYYSVHGRPASRQPHQTGAGHPADEEDNADDPSPNIIENTFGTDEETQEQFFAVLAETNGMVKYILFLRLYVLVGEVQKSFKSPLQSQFGFIEQNYGGVVGTSVPQATVWTRKTFAELLILKVNFVIVKIFILDMRMKDTVPSVGMDTDEEAYPSSSGTAAVKEIFNRVAGKQGGSVLSTKAAAREEVLLTLASTCLTNYSKLSKGPGPSSASLQKTRRDTTTSSQPTTSQVKRSTMSGTSISTFCIVSVGILICGVNRHGTIRVPKAPLKNGMNEIQAMKNCGCYVDEQTTFHHDWSYSKIGQLLRKLFPKVFNYLDSERPRSFSSSQSAGQDEKPHWRLLNKSRQALTIVDIACPTGTDLAKHKGWDKASVTESHLWFVTRNHIPDSVYESWNTQPIIAGSDSEGDSDSSEVELLSDVDSVRDNADHNPELASSLMEMELSDSVDIRTGYKGKGKLKISKTPMVNAKWTHTVLSPDESPTNQRVVAKKLKSKTAIAIPHFLPLQSLSSLNQLSIPGVPAAYATCPELSHPATIVSVSEADILFRNQPQPNDPFAPAIINPWESEYVIRPVDYLI